MRPREIPTQDLLANVPLFKQLTAAARARIAERVTRLPLRRGDTVFHRGETPAGFFVIVYGEIALTATGARGPRLTGLVGPGRSFGEPVMFLGKPYIVNARAHTDALLLLVPRDVIFAEIERNPAFAHRMIAGLAARIEALVREIDAHASGSARERVIDYLVRASGKREGEVAVRIPTTKAALASQLGLSAEHLSRILRDLARRKLARVDGRRIAIPDIAALAADGRAPAIVAGITQ